MKSKLKNIIVRILTWEAKRMLKKHKPKVVAVTGSVGKTSTKDAIYTALSHSEYTRKSEKSFNSDIGVPLTILGLPNAWNSSIGWLENIAEGYILPWRKEAYPERLVIEMGVDRPGDIQRFGWLTPNIIVFTQFPNVPVHVEYFDSPDEVTEEKRSLKGYLTQDGTLIVNADDTKMAHETVREGQNILSYGLSEHATVRGTEYKIEYEEDLPMGISFIAQFQDKKVPIRLSGILGRHHMYPALAALTVLVSEGKMFSEADALFAEYTPAPGRMRLLKGMNKSVIIDDSYNSSPAAVQAGIEAVTSINTKGKKIMVLGDMLELGDFSVDEHKAVGTLVATSADVFISVGVRMRAAAEAAYTTKGRCGRIETFQNATETLELLRMIIGEGDIVFVKGSQGMRMERIVENILLDPQAGVYLLPRQDSHWKEIR